MVEQSIIDFIAAMGAMVVLGSLLYLVVSRAQRSMAEARKKQAKKAKDGTVIRLSQFPVDKFFKANGYSYDYVIAMPVYHKDKGFKGKKKSIQKEIKRYSVRRVAEAIAAAGMEVKLEWSNDFKMVLIKIRAPLKRLKQEGDRINYRVLLNPDNLKRRLEKGVEGKWAGVFYKDEKDEAHGLYRPFDYIYGPYDTKDEDGFQTVYATHAPSYAIFKSADRIKLIVSILEAPASAQVKGAGLDLARLDAHQVIDSHFPIHIVRELTTVQKPIMNIAQMPWNMPLEEIRSYFGEKVGLYFAWVAHYTTFLTYAAAAGFITWIDVVIEDTPNAALVVFFCFFMAIWATLFLEYWKRNEATLSMKWGTSEFEDEEQPRPGFLSDERTELINSPVTGHEVPFFPLSERAKVLRYSMACIVASITIVIICVSFAFYLKVLFVRDPLLYNGVDIGVFIPGIFNAIQIQIGNRLYGMLAIYLNDLENHRTDTEYEDYLIGKTFAFQFVNSYASLIYIAFLKDNVNTEDAARCIDYDGDGNGDCMQELGFQLGTILLMRLVVDNVLEIGLPAALRWYRNRDKPKDKPSTVPMRVADQAELEEYDVLMGTFEDYAEMIIQYGYTTMFVAAFPLAPLVALIASWIELRVDGYKLCYLTRRPQPRGAQDIGTWQNILEVIGFLASAINVGIFCFTGDFFFLRGLVTSHRFLVFVFLEHFLLMMKYLLAVAVPDMPEPVKIQGNRQDFMNSKIFGNAEDEDDDDIANEIAGAPADLSISVAVDPWDVMK
uniref:Anoctamin dimerisation domain-containing protein n=1 Tax=Phaeomonas parva TaxID=124430 RepID=A0A7S1U4L4_9STRA|mmetsp:Transcript_28558/g.91598  ORF Transcript_28558/g.91598 Transcript_28558/m.91598 type:complete len:776 (+) Transcript_28558:160-2487(+)|eukprot:CAMPEP_0118854162 /NCGR_PEP_ID=MMETSP1163-20130328/2481_1 /TAXON_ID=124430 /ORGANISM="Phaeomonas parva, Strain CCMP2877" /LENGTH=775 /DNA_ID=CAMNT_0006786841 /DNA_START=187 /DNA_END=2514 /DNA_ORIENTATION=-